MYVNSIRTMLLAVAVLMSQHGIADGLVSSSPEGASVYFIAPSGDLVEQWLEHVVVMAIYDRHLCIGILQPAGCE